MNLKFMNMKKIWFCVLAFLFQETAFSAPLTEALFKAYTYLQIPESLQNFKTMEKELKKAFCLLTPENLFNDSSLRLRATELFKLKSVFDSHYTRSLADLMNEGILEKKNKLPAFNICQNTPKDLRIAFEELQWLEKWSALVSKDTPDFYFGKGWITYHKIQDFLFFSFLEENTLSYQSKHSSPPFPHFQIKSFSETLKLDCQGLKAMFQKVSEYEYQKNQAQLFDFLDPAYPNHAEYLELKYFLFFKYENHFPENKKKLFFNSFYEKQKKSLSLMLDKQQAARKVVQEQIIRLSDKVLEWQKQRKKFSHFSTTQRSDHFAFEALLKHELEKKCSEVCDILGNRDWFLHMMDSELLKADKIFSKIILRKMRQFVREEKRTDHKNTFYCSQVEILRKFNSYKKIAPIFGETEYVCQVMEGLAKEPVLTEEDITKIIKDSLLDYQFGCLKIQQKGLLWHIRTHYGAKQTELQEIESESFLSIFVSEYLSSLNMKKEQLTQKTETFTEGHKHNVEKLTLEKATDWIQKYLKVHDHEEAFQNIGFDARCLRAASFVYQEKGGIYPQLKEVGFLNQLLGYLKGLKKMKKLRSQDQLIKKEEVPVTVIPQKEEGKNIADEVPVNAFLKKRVKGHIITTWAPKRRKSL
jgi:hypothetical protein